MAPSERPVVLLLGPVAIAGPVGPVTIGGMLPRGLLAVLALDAGRPVSIDRLTDQLWGDDPPAAPREAIQQLASRVRRALRDAGVDAELRSAAPGYVLAVDPEAVDLHRSRRLARRAFLAAGEGALESALADADAALSLWRGAALEDLVDLPIGRTASFLDGERWRLEEVLAESLLAAGRAGQVVDRLDEILVREPLRERLRLLYARSLVALGRDADALRTVRAGIEAVTSSLGVQADPELVEMSRRLGVRTPIGTSLRVDDIVPVDGELGSLMTAGVQRAIDRAASAADQAMARRAYAEAIHQWHVVLDLAVHDDQAIVRALLGLGAVHNEGGSEAAARECFERCLVAARRLGDRTLLAEAVLGYCSDRIRMGAAGAEEALLDEALAAVGVADLALRARLLARQAGDRYWRSSIAEVEAIAREAQECALRSGDVEARLAAGQAGVYASWAPSLAHQLHARATAYLDDAHRAGRRDHELLARRWLVVSCTELDRILEARQHLEQALALADELGLAAQRWLARTLAAAQALLLGQFDEADRLADEALAIGAVAEPATALDYVGVFLWTLRWIQGRLAEVLPLAREVATGAGADMTRRIGLVTTLAAAGELAEARERRAAIDAREFLNVPQDGSWYVCMSAAADAARLLGDTELAAIVGSLLSPYRDHIGATLITTTGPVVHDLGVCAAVVGDHERAVEHLRTAVERCDRSGLAGFGVRSRTELARCLVVLERRHEAFEVARTALATARSLGAPELVSDLVSLLESIDAR